MKNSKTNFEEAMAELESIVGKLEKGELTLDESINCFKKGIELSRFCGKRLDEAERKITLLIENENGEVTEKDMPEKNDE
jgi:exodeoxyribonuclease VII small subunit